MVCSAEGSNHSWAGLGFPFARVKMDAGTWCQFIFLLATGVSRAISGCSH